MSRRSGQNGTVVIAGNWYRVDGVWMRRSGKTNQYEREDRPVVFDKNGEPKLPSAEVEVRPANCREVGCEFRAAL